VELHLGYLTCGLYLAVLTPLQHSQLNPARGFHHPTPTDPLQPCSYYTPADYNKSECIVCVKMELR